MDTLHVISKRDSNSSALGELKEAAVQKNIKLNVIYTEEFDFSKPPTLSKTDGLYKIATDQESSFIEKLLITDEVSSFYSDYRFCLGRFDNVAGATLLHQKVGLPIIPSVFTLTNNQTLLDRYADYLGGFPLIIKSAGKAHGVGVLKIDSFEALISAADYLVEQEDYFILRKFIPHKRQARLVVLGDNIIASHENIVSGDFRTNVAKEGDRKRSAASYDVAIQNIAVQAVRSLQLEFGGVDILFDEHTDEPYLAEVNFPCFFPITSELSGVNIAEHMISYLVEKSKQ